MDKQMSYHEKRKQEHTELLDAPPHKYAGVEKYILSMYRKVQPTPSEIQQRDDLIKRIAEAIDKDYLRQKTPGYI